MLNITFNTLFSVEVKHAYYRQGICPDFLIIPSLETIGILNNYNMIWRQHNNMLYIGMLTNDDPLSPPDANHKIPFLLPDVNERFAFYLQCKNPLFYNFTDMPLDQLVGNILYLTNRDNNTVNNIPCLSVAPSGYVSASDLIAYAGNSFKYTLSNNLSAGTVQVMDSYTNIVILSQPFTIPESQNFVSVDLSALTTGKYSLSVAGQPGQPVVLVCYSSEFAGNNYCGVIDIFNTFFTTGGQFLTNFPKYQIFFANRSTIWKYILLNGTTADSITVKPDNYTFNTPLPDTQAQAVTNIMVSTTAIPLSETPLSLTLAYTPPPPAMAQTVCRIPGAVTDRLATKDAASGPYYYSEIYLNY